MKNEILEILKKENKALTVHEINDRLGFTSVEDFKEVIKTLNEMADDISLRKTNKDKYVIHDIVKERKGIVISKGSYAFIHVIDDKKEIRDIYVHESNMGGAIHGDKVIVSVRDINSERPEGKITKIAERDLKNMVGEVHYIDGVATIKLDDEKVNINVIIDSNRTMNAVEGHKVLVKITKKLEGNTYRGEVLIILGHKDDPGVDILSVVYKFGINDTFSEKVLEELDLIPDAVLPEEIEGRRDLRKEVIFTIDGDDTKDIDDAISINELENGNFVLGVHIADVSHYVKDGTELYKEALDRGTSVYLADRVIPMLPHKLSNGICSLNPNVDRLAMSCVMEIDTKGNVVSNEIFESIISSRKQMTYKKVNKVLEENIIPEGYEEFADSLRTMKKLADILRDNKVARGYIDFDIDETGKAIDVILRERGTGEKLIEDFMIAANETVASYIFYMELPFIYRVHGVPSEEKIKLFIDYIGNCGYQLTGNFKEVHPSTMQNILDQLKDKPEFHIFSSLLLRSMQKAIYDTANIGHFGLGSTCYTHFTSPIRRFPDTTVHRLIHQYIVEGKINRETIAFEEQNLPYIAEHSSKKERDSVECEREVDDMKKAEYMEQHVGEEFTGMVSSITNFGMFIELPNLIEGLIRLDDLKDDHYTFDESTIRLIGKKNKRGYHLGDTVEVIVKASNKETRQIDFVMNNEGNEIYKKSYIGSK